MAAMNQSRQCLRSSDVDPIRRILAGLPASLVLAGFAACATGGAVVEEMALPASPGRPALIEYPRVPDIVAEACRDAIENTGWSIASIGRAFDYRGSAYVDYRVVRADRRQAAARCVYSGQSGRARLHSLSPPAGPVSYFASAPEGAAEACRAELHRLGWRIASTGRAVGYGGAVVADYHLVSSTGDRSSGRCFYDGSTRTARIEF